jgi:hypothetical protein
VDRNHATGGNDVTAINGTSGNDYIDNSEAGDFEIFGGAGNDTLAVRRQSYQPGVVTLDGGTGDDRIVVQVYGTQTVTARGGAGDDVFTLISGGILYGDAGADVFETYSSPGGNAPIIADFQSNDRFDLSPFLKGGTAWVATTNPFGGNFARLVQLGADTVVQGNSAVSGWTNLAVLKGVTATSLTSAQFGFTPSVASTTFVAVTVAQPAMEGGLLAFNLSLSAAAESAVSVNVLAKVVGPGSTSSQSVTVVIPKGQTTGVLNLSTFEDSVVGDGRFELVQLTVSGAQLDPRSGFSGLNAIISDNDKNGFSVSVLSAPAYKTMTQLAEVKPADSFAVTMLDISSEGTRGKVRTLEAYTLGTTSVALTAYQFFTGKSPGEAGLKYLVNSPDNTSDLNDASGIYTAMNTENRYINFAANLGLNGEGKVAFAAAYGGLTFRQAVEKAYDVVIGKAYAQASGINVQAAIDGVVAASSYFDALATQRMSGFDHDLAMKAGMVGYLLAEGQKAHVGVYGRAVENFYIDLADGTARHNVDLVAVYGPGTFLDAI